MPLYGAAWNNGKCPLKAFIALNTKYLQREI